MQKTRIYIVVSMAGNDMRPQMRRRYFRELALEITQSEEEEEDEEKTTKMLQK